jgi:toxin CcdB
VAQFDIYANPNTAQRPVFPFVVQVQSDFLDSLPTRLVVPLQRPRIPPHASPRRLTETLHVGGEDLYVAAHLAGALPAKLLLRPVASAAARQFVVRDALDAVVSGV